MAHDQNIKDVSDKLNVLSNSLSDLIETESDLRKKLKLKPVKKRRRYLNQHQRKARSFVTNIIS